MAQVNIESRAVYQGSVPVNSEKIIHHGARLIRGLQGVVFDNALAKGIKAEIAEAKYDLHQKAGYPPIDPNRK